MHDEYLTHLRRAVDVIRADGFYKAERVIESPQSSQIVLSSGAEVLNFCANNYLGLADDPRLVAAAREGLDRYGFGMASVRFICGTQTVHKELEAALAAFLGTDDSDPLFELLRRQWRPVRDAARRRGRDHQRRAEPRRASSTASGCARRSATAIATTTWPTSRRKLNEADAAGARFKLIATDGVFSMDGIIADLQAICDLADAVRRAGRWSTTPTRSASSATAAAARRSSAASRAAIDIVTGTLGKALGGASGGYIAGAQARSSSCCASARGPISSPTRWRRAIAAASLAVLELLHERRRRGAARARARERRAFPRAR